MSAASPVPPSRQTASAVFDQQRPGRTSGVTLSIDYVNPNDPAAKPYAVQRTITEFAKGTVIDTSVPKRCGASDGELIANGASVCPDASRVGSGEVVLDTGAAGPARTSDNGVTLLNAQDQLILLIEPKSGPPIRFVTRASVKGRTILSDVPPIPGGPPDGFTAVKRVRLHTNAISLGPRRYMTTPESCPASGWRNATTFIYRDGITETAVNRSPCVPMPSHEGDDRPPRIRLSGVKRHGCTERAFVVRVSVVERKSGLRSVRLSLDSRVLVSTRRAEFSRRIPAGRLAPGQHRLTVRAGDRAVNNARSSVHFRRCGAEDADGRG